MVVRRAFELCDGEGQEPDGGLDSLRKCCWSVRIGSIQSERAAEASMLIRAISLSAMRLTCGSNAAAHCGRSRLTSAAKYDPQRRHPATVAMATSPKCGWDFGESC